MRVFNPDGSEPEMCGNGIRIFARYLREGRGAVAEDGVRRRDPGRPDHAAPARRSGTVRVDMGRARFQSANIDRRATCAAGRATGGRDRRRSQLEAAGRTHYRFTFVDVGNPHCVIVVDDPAAVDVPLESWAPSSSGIPSSPTG